MPGRRLAPVVLVVATALLAGCLGAQDPGTEAGTAGLDGNLAEEVGDRLTAHTPEAPVPVPEAWGTLSTRIEATGHQRGEPTVGVTGDGTIWTVGEDGAAIRSTDHGRTWEVADDPATRPKPDIDPFLWVDADTDRVYNSRLHVAGTWLSWTDDGGETWMANPGAGLGTPGHDHQKITTGPPPEGVETDGYPNVLYYVYNAGFRGFAGPDDVDGTWVSVSYDGGRTFPEEARVHPPDCRGGIAAPAAVGPDGLVYVPKHTCGGVAVARSADGGASWERVAHVTDVGAPEEWALDPMATVDDAGNVYVVFQGDDGLVYLTHSGDRGETWSDPVDVTPPSVGGTVFPDVFAGAEGEVAIAYLGTTSNATEWEGNDPSYAPDSVVWHAYLAFPEGVPAGGAGDAGGPTFVTHRVTPDGDPVQRGCVWHHGGAEDCRNLRDFMDLTQRDGRVYFVWPDGCDACETAEESRRQGETTVAIQERGPGLEGGVVEPLLDGSG